MSHRIQDDTKEFWVKCLSKVLLGLSDQQLITCLAILVIAVVKLADGTLSVYHFGVCVDMAWFSNMVHAFTLDVLSVYFRRRVKFPPLRADTLGRIPEDSQMKVRKRRRRLPFLTGLRLVLMAVSGILLVFCLVIQGHRNWYDNYGCPVDCVRKDLKGNYGGDPGFWSTFSIVILLYSQPSAMISLTNTGVRWQHKIRFTYMKKLDGKLRPDKPPESLWVKCYIVLRTAATYFWYIGSSTIVNVLIGLTWFAIGIWSIVVNRQYAHNIMEDQKVENEELEWGFGQLVPLIFCILPFIAAGEAFWGKS